ncbi:MAG TPA: hypothetical protein VHQ47_18445 [Phycisphaerae bacterium]|nr:hypothetical protein [Phycisphaerae bacterium]
MLEGAAKSAISRPTLLRAKAALNIQSSRRTFLGKWFWDLPNDTREPTSTLEMPFGNIAEMLNTVAK